MIAAASGLVKGVARFSRVLRGVGVLAMPFAGLDTTRRVGSVFEVPPGAGVLRLLVPGMGDGVYIDRHCVADGVEDTRWVISATQELFSEDEEIEF